MNGAALSHLEILAIAVALAMDAFAVSVATGVVLGSPSRRQTFRLSWHFGLFQALMPVVGWAAGLTVQSAIASVDHWVAFGLLALIGGHMFHEGLGGGEGETRHAEPTRGWTLIMLSVATSLDALAVGLSLAMLGVDVWLPALIIGLVAAGFTATGIHLGAAMGRRLRLAAWAEIFGGVVLVGIGFKILLEHGALAALF